MLDSHRLTGATDAGWLSTQGGQPGTGIRDARSRRKVRGKLRQETYVSQGYAPAFDLWSF
jgi:hypothetical protein